MLKRAKTVLAFLPLVQLIWTERRQFVFRQNREVKHWITVLGVLETPNRGGQSNLPHRIPGDETQAPSD